MNSQQIQPELFQRLLPVVQRVRLRRVFLTIAIVLMFGAIFGLGVMELVRNGQVVNGLPIWGSFLAVFVVLAIAGGIIAATTVDTKLVVEHLEKRYPELDAALLTALEQEPDPKKMSFLQREVIRTAIYHSYQNRWSTTIPAWHWLGAPVVAFVALGSLALSTILIARTKPVSVPTNEVSFESTLVKTKLDFELLQVEPGNADIEKGNAQLVVATFSGDTPATAELVVTQGEEEFRLPMNKSLDDPVFGARINRVDQDTLYRVEFGDSYSETYKLRVFEYPAMVSNEAKVEYPPYTSKPLKTYTNVRRLSAVTGSTAELTLQLNQAVEEAKLIPKEGEPLWLQPVPGDPTRQIISIPFRNVGSTRYELQLQNSVGRKNKENSRLVVNVQANKLPKIRLVKPSRDTQVSAVEELDLKAKIYDDFGIQRVGFSYSVGDLEKEVELGSDLPQSQKEVEALLDMEALAVEPRQMVSYYFWVEDQIENKKTRRVSSDLFFAEVRPFDEIYRQSQGAGNSQNQQRSQSSQQNNDARGTQQALKLQKDIVNAAWNTLRRERRKRQPICPIRSRCFTHCRLATSGHPVD